jgi:hypothetical protein
MAAGGCSQGTPYRHGLFPPITMLQHVMHEDIAPETRRAESKEEFTVPAVFAESSGNSLGPKNQDY